MKFLLSFVFLLLLLSACQSKDAQNQQVTQIVILDQLDLYPQYTGCPDYYDKKEQLDCLMQKLTAFLNYNLNKNYAQQFDSVQDTVWVKFQIDTLGNTNFLNIIHFNDSLIDRQYAAVFKKIALTIPKMKPAVYQGRPVSFEFKIPVVKQRNKKKDIAD